MKFGTIALIDALGFKGIWSERRGGPAKAKAMLRAVQKALETEREWAEAHWRQITKGERVPEFARSIEFTTHFMSDTAAIAAAAELPAGWENDKDPHSWTRTLSGSTMYMICRALPPALRAAALAETSVAYRGAIACGEMDLAKDFTVGPAVDDAATGMEAADGAFVWLMPSALAFCRRLQSWQWAHVWERTVEFPVSLSGRAFRTQVVNPFIFQDAPPEPGTIDSLEAAILGSFRSDDLGVQIKRQNTARFLSRARAWVSTTSVAVEHERAQLVAALVEHSLAGAAKAWATAERKRRVQADQPIPARFPGTEADAVALVAEAKVQVDPTALWKEAFRLWVENLPAVP